MEIIEDNYVSDSHYHRGTSKIYHLNHDDNLSSIFEMRDQSFDESLNRSFEDCNVSTEYSSKMPDNLSDKTPSIDNEFEVMLFDYSKIVSCLITECCQRSDIEIATLSQLLQSIPEFMCMNSIELELVCQAARLITFERPNQLIIRRCTSLEEWYFCLSGSMRREDNNNTILTAGNYIGAALGSMDILISDYNLYSNSDDCKLMVISKDDLTPSKKLKELIIKTNDEDKTVVAVYEPSSNFINQFAYVLSKGTPEILINNLLSNPNHLHRDFVEDFFMTHKLYSPQTSIILNDIYSGIDEDLHEAKDKFDILIRWMSQNYSEFEKDENKIKFINDITSILVNQKKQELLYLLYDCSSNKSSIRQVKTKLSFVANIVPVIRENDRTIFYIDNVNNNELLKNGDVIISIEEYSQDCLSKELVRTLCEENKPLTLSVRNDILGYHENILKDLYLDSCSIHSTPSSSDHCYSDKDTMSVSTNDSETFSTHVIDISPDVKKRPSLLPNFMSTLQNGTVGKFFKNPKTYSKTLLPSHKSISNDSTDSKLIFQRPSNISSSTMSIYRISRRLKNQRKSASSNPEIMKSFDEREATETDSFIIWSLVQMNSFPIQIFWKDVFINSSEFSSSSSSKCELKSIYLMIKPAMTVLEIIILTLVKLEVTSTSSDNFYLVEVKVDEVNAMIHEKILKPTSTNLRLKIHSRYYLKHKSFVGNNLILNKEAEKLISEVQNLSLIHLSLDNLIVSLFLKSHNLLSGISPNCLISHVTNGKSTLRINRHHNYSENDFNKYILLSDFYKNWVITEICSEPGCAVKRSKIIQYFIWLAYKSMYVGHIELFFSLISGLDSTEISRLHVSWDKVSSQDKKLFSKLKSTLDVSGNMRNLRSLHQRMVCPFIPVTAMVIKDLTMIDETNPTFVEGFINGLQVNKNLVNFDKMRKMAKLSRIFINSSCSCEKDKSKPIRKHFNNCSSRLENARMVENLLFKRLEEESNSQSHSYSINSTQKVDRKHSASNLSVKSSSSDSIPDTNSSTKSSQDHWIHKTIERQKMNQKIDLYLSRLEKMVVHDPTKLSEMSLLCEQGILFSSSTLKSKSLKNIKLQTDLFFNHNHYQTDVIDTNEISDKAAEILGLKNKSKIHIYKKSGES